MDELDDELRLAVARRRLAREDLDARDGIVFRRIAQRKIRSDGLQDVEELPLVLVDALDVDVEQRGRVDLDTCALGDERRERVLCRAALARERLAKRGVIGERHQRTQRVGIFLHLRPDDLEEKCKKRAVRLEQPAAERDAVGLVDDLVRMNRVQVAEHRLAHETGVQRRHAVDAMRAEEREMAHAHAALARFVEHR